MQHHSFPWKRYKNPRCIEVDRSLLEDTIISVLMWNCNVSSLEDTFVKEFAALKEGHVLSHYIFVCPYSWDLLLKSERHQAMWLIENRHGIPYWMAKSLITKAVMGTTSTDDDIVVYVKGHEKREWLRDLLLDEARRVMWKISRCITKT